MFCFHKWIIFREAPIYEQRYKIVRSEEHPGGLIDRDEPLDHPQGWEYHLRCERCGDVKQKTLLPKLTKNT